MDSSSSGKPTDFTAFSSSAGFAAFNSGAAILNQPGIPPVIYLTADSEHVLERLTPSGIPDENNINQRSADEKSRIADESVDNSRNWKLTEINESSQCCSLRLPDSFAASRVSRLIYTNFGSAILALTANAVHKRWAWSMIDEAGKATASVVPQLWQPSSGIWTANDISGTNPEVAVPCLALSKNGCFAMSASGGKVSLYSLTTPEMYRIATFAPPPPTATYIAFYDHQDSDIIAVGMEDSSIQIYSRLDEVNWKLKGHRERITGLAFSNVLHVLVSSGADSQLCVWSTDGWQQRRSKRSQIPVGRAMVPLTECIQFHQEQTCLLAVHATHIAIYKAPTLKFLNQWIPPEGRDPHLITHATYSCDSQSIYVGFNDGSVRILTASPTLQLRCIINSTSYLPAGTSSRVHPLVIAAHPSKPNQFALGLADGGVCIVEPIEPGGKWGTSPPRENVARPMLL